MFLGPYDGLQFLTERSQETSHVYRILNSEYSLSFRE